MRFTAIRRMLWIACTVALMVLVARAASVNALAALAPSVAVQFDGNNAGALVADAEQALMKSAGKFNATNLAATSRKALRAEPLSATALRQLGLAVDALGQPKQAADIMRVADSVSRHDLAVQMWLIEDRVRANDVVGALVHYDVALSTNDRGVNIFYPVLTGALDDPEIRKAFIPYLVERRRWVWGFLNYAIAMSPNPQSIAAIMMAQKSLQDDLRYRTLQTQLLVHLVARQQYQVARRYAAMLPGVTDQLLSDARISPETSDPRMANLAWQLTDDAAVTARLNEGNALEVSAGSDIRSVAAMRVFVLPPGLYRFAQTVGPVANVSPAKITWQLWCLPITSDASPLWEQSFAAAKTSSTAVQIDVPARCLAQQLTIIVANGEGDTSSSADVRAVSLRPAG